ncbi:MAG TPA: alpha/beta hydrolase [Propionicimonas sp.]|nr:alpha/beta hydrolase [Propionicimonas sp.]
MEELRIELDSGAEVVAYRSGPESTAPTVVLLHGIGMTHRTFDDLQPLLAGDLSVISLDLPGFGATRKPPRPFTVDDHAQAVDEALDRLGVGSRILVGHSMGSQFAVEQAILHPDEVVGLVLVAPVVDSGRRTLPAQARDLAVDTFRETPRANARVLVDYVRCGLPWYLVTVKAMFDYDTETQLRLVSCDVVVVRGERDPVVREPWCRKLVEIAAKGTLVTVPGHAHCVPLTAPQAIIDAVRRLLRDARTA